MTQSNQTVEAERDRLSALLSDGRLRECIAGARTLLAEHPDDWEALYLLAVALRYEGNLDGALRAIEQLLDLKPDYGRAYQELGHNMLARRQVGDAIAGYESAIQFNPALAASWRSLAELLGRVGETQAALKAQRQFESLSRQSPALVTLQSYLHEGRLLKADRLARDILLKDPCNVEAMRLLASIAVTMNVLDEAEFLLASAHEFEPENALVQVDLAGVLHRRQNYSQSLDHARRLLATDPDNPVYLTLVANAELGLGNYSEALSHYDAVLAVSPQAATIHLSRGHALKTIGEQDAAIEAYRNAYRSRTGFGDAYWSLANLKTYRFTDAELADMDAAANQPRTLVEDRIHVNFALGKAYEDRGDVARSFQHYVAGNRAKHNSIGYSAELFDDEVQTSIEYCNAALFAGCAGQGNPSAEPIFVTGMPRAGSTLIEQILASHSQIEGTAELPIILSLINEFRCSDNVGWKRYQPFLKELTAEDLQRLGGEFLQQSLAFRQGAPYFIDKMPNNFRHIGFIRMILPQARIIDARRHPLACCFSNFKQLFAQGQEFSYSLEDIASYYRGYVRLMDHWDAVLPGAVLRIHYENVVADIETQTRRLLDFCGVPFEEQCLQFHKTERAVRTASSEQVRLPIFQSGLRQWAKFEAFIEPLKDLLHDEIVRYEADCEALSGQRHLAE